MKNAWLLGISCVVLSACGVYEDTPALPGPNGPECVVNADCDTGKVCTDGKCVLAPVTSPDLGIAPATDLASTPTNFVARSTGDYVVEFNAQYLSEAEVAQLVGEPLPFKWDTGPEATRQVKNGQKYYSFDFTQYSLSRGNNVFRLTYVDPHRTNGDVWAEYGGEATFASLPVEAQSWLCQHVDNQDHCVTDVFVRYDGIRLTAAGKDVCPSKAHRNTCRNLHP